MNALYKLSVIVETIDKLSGPVRKMMGAVQGLERAAQKGKALVEFGQRTSLTGALVQGAADKMKGMMFDLIAPTMEIQDAMASLKTVTTSTLGSVEKSMELTRQRALEWSKAHTDSAADYIRTAYTMASAGLNDVQAIAATETAMRVAKATMADSAETANLVAIMYNNMGDKTRDVQKEMARLGDVLTRTQQYFQFENLGQLTEGLKYAIPAALQYKTSVEELNVVIGQLNNAGLQGSMAGTAFAATMRQIIPASRELGFEIARDAQGGVSLIGTIENIRKKFGDFGSMSDDMRVKFQKAFGDEGLRAISLLTGKVNDMKKGLIEVQGAAGAAARAQAEMESTASQQYQILQNNITAVKAQIGEQLIPVINQVIPPIRQGIQWLGRFTDAHPGLTRTIVLIAAIGTGALAIVAPLLMVVGGFMSVMGTGVQAAATVGRAIVKLGPLARGAGRHIQEAFTWSREAIRSVGPGLARLGGQLISFGRTAILQAASGIRALGLGIVNFGRQAIRTAITSLPPLIAQVWAFTAALLANPITWVIIAVVALGGALYLLIRHWDAVKAAVSDAWAKIVGATRTAIAWVRENLIGL